MSFCFADVKENPDLSSRGALYVHVSDEDLGFRAPTTVLFNGSDSLAFEVNDEFEVENGLLVGKGRLITREEFANFHLRIRIRYPERIRDTFSLNLEEVPIYRGSREASEHLGEWLDLEFLCRHLPGEQANIRFLNQGFIHYGGNGQQFHDDNLYRLDQFPIDERRYITGESRYFPGQRQGLFLDFEFPVEIARMEITPLVPNSPREVLALVGEEREEFVGKGADVYARYCVNCHGNGVDAAPNPLARSFATQDLQNGSSQLEIYRTLTTGFNTMPPMTVLTVEERHLVAAYIREKIIRPHRPSSYKQVDRASIEALPHPLYTLDEAYERANKPEQQIEKKRGYFRDHGPALVNGYGDIARNAFHVRLPDEVAVSYDLHTLSLIDVRTDGFLDMLTSQEFQQRPSSGVLPAGIPNRSLGGSSWIRNGKLLSVDSHSSKVSGESSLRYFGHYLNEDEAVLSYEFEGRPILESPSAVRKGEALNLTQHFSIGQGKAIRLGLIPCDLTPVPSADGSVTVENGGRSVRFQIDDDGSGSFSWILVKGHLAVEVPASSESLDFALTRSVGTNHESIIPKKLLNATEGGPRNWPATYTVTGELSTAEGDAYVLDTIPVPFENEYHAWMRTTALAFFPDGRAAVTTYGGDVWIVSGIDQDLDEVTWSRFASGMFEAFGCEVIDDLIHVTTRNGMVRLHDLNRDGEADFYEQFFADPDISARWHAYNFDLVRDSEGYLYYARSGQFTDSKLEGGAYRIAPDGRSYELFGSGFRTPNGMGLLPGDRVTFADNQGAYVPAGKLSIIHPKGWHGGSNLQGPDGEKRERVKPMLWFPQEIDNSCGGQHFVDDERFGPYNRHLIHTSCGRAEAMVVFIDELPDGTIQAASQTLPFHFRSGVMRPRINPTDGQLYLTGTRGWQIRADYDGCLQRIRYTGAESPLLIDAKAREGGIELTFNQAIDGELIEVDQFAAEQWNYRWAASYGSKKYSVRNAGEVGSDPLKIEDIELRDAGKTVWVSIPELKPCDNLSLRYRIPNDAGGWSENGINMTIHKLPARLK